MKRIGLVGVLGLASFVVPILAQADAATFDVTLRLTASCTVDSAEAVPFGTLSKEHVQAGGAMAKGGVAVTCSKGTSYDVGLSGSNGARQMRSANGSTVDYRLFQEPGETVEWDNESVLSATGTGAQVKHPVHGVLPGGMSIDPRDSLSEEGTDFRDTVTVTLTF